MAEEKKAKTLVDLINETVSKHKIEKTGNIFALIPRDDSESPIMMTQDTRTVLAMYKKPKTGKDWSILDTHAPVLLNAKRTLVDVPISIKIENKKALIRFRDNTDMEMEVLSRNLMRAFLFIK